MTEAKFYIRKSKRLAEVRADGEYVDAYVSNGADLKFMKAGSVCYLREVDSMTRQTGYDLYSIYDKDTLVCVDAKEPLRIAKEWYVKSLKEEFPNEKIHLYEDNRGLTLESYRPNIYIQVMGTSLVHDKTAYLPERPSSALNRRLEDLLVMKSRGMDCRLMIVVCREDADIFVPNEEEDFQFDVLLANVIHSGIPADCLRCKVNAEGMKADQIIPIDV